MRSKFLQKQDGVKGKAFEMIDKLKVRKCISETLASNVKDLRKLVSNPETGVLEAIVGAVALQAIDEGSSNKAEWLMSRSIGPLSDIQEVYTVNLGVDMAEEQRLKVLTLLRANVRGELDASAPLPGSGIVSERLKGIRD